MIHRLCLTMLVCMLAVGCQSVQWPWTKSANDPVAELDDPGTTAPVVPEQGLALSPEQRFSDLPLPMGVKPDLERSFVYESQTLQVGRMVYNSKASINELSQFFIRECPTANWKLQNVTEAGGTQLAFTKPDRRLTVSITSLGVGRGQQIVLLLIPDTN